MSLSVRLADSPFAADRELAEFSANLGGVGAVVSFVGIARDQTMAGKPVERLLLEAHPRLTFRSMEVIGESALERFDVEWLRIVHRCGFIIPGESIVFVAAAAVHRRPAFEAVDYMMDRLKTDALFWKREDGPDGASWIEPRDDDHVARQRWRLSCQE